MKKLSILLFTVLALFCTGCTSLFSDASTHLEIETPQGYKAKYKSPKDQKIHYNPATGEILVESKTNAELAAEAAKADSEAKKATAEMFKSIAEKLTPITIK